VNALLELANRCEVATGGDTDLDRELWARCVAVPPLTPEMLTKSIGYVRPAAYTSSVDAAISLVPADCEWMIRSGPWAKVWLPDHTAYPNDFYCGAANAALSLCVAALRAASAIEAQRAETVQQGSVEDESAVAKPDAQGDA
jgi:hypothetical protein